MTYGKMLCVFVNGLTLSLKLGFYELTFPNVFFLAIISHRGFFIVVKFCCVAFSKVFIHLNFSHNYVFISCPVRFPFHSFELLIASETLQQPGLK